MNFCLKPVSCKKNNFCLFYSHKREIEKTHFFFSFFQKFWFLFSHSDFASARKQFFFQKFESSISQLLREFSLVKKYLKLASKIQFLSCVILGENDTKSAKSRSEERILFKCHVNLIHQAIPFEKVFHQNQRDAQSFFFLFKRFKTSWAF